MKSRWDDAGARRAVDRWGEAWGEDVALRVYSSRLLGAEPSLVLHGGGNTSVKTTTAEPWGDPVEVLRVKSSGADLAALEPEDLPACRLEPLRRMTRLESLTDERMVAGLRGQLVDPTDPSPSVEALLHAILPGRFVDHTHADAALAILDQPDSQERARAVWGDRAVFVPYAMAGFALARRVAGLRDGIEEGAELIVLDKHGLFTWGDGARESYERMIDAVDAAERYVAAARASKPPPPTHRGTERTRRARQAAVGPVLRGALARMRDGRRLILEWRDGDRVLDLIGREDAERSTGLGAATPDHVTRTKPFPAWLGDLPREPERLRAAVEGALEAFARRYEAYFEKGAAALETRPARLDLAPRVLVAPSLGILGAGRTRSEARAAADLYAHTAGIVLDATALGAYEPPGEQDLFDIEYWSLQQAKLGRHEPGGGPLDGRIALVTGAASGIGLATARHFLDLGAHVMLSDVNAEGLEAAARDLDPTRTEWIVADVTKDEDVARAIEKTSRAFGGLDLVVSNAGNAPSGLLHTAGGDAALRASIELNLMSHQRVARLAAEVMIAQGTGGCLLFNASKSAFNPGPEFGPYAVPKAGVVALTKQYAIDLGRHGIRSNAVNADRIRTELFGGGLLEKRARARGVSPDEYFRQNLLHRETTGLDVARAFAALACAEATTGCVVPVDGGNAAAFPR